MIDETETKQEDGNISRTGEPGREKVAKVLAIILSLYAVVYALGIPNYFGLYIYSEQNMAIVLILSIILTFLQVPMLKGASRTKLPWYDYIFIGLSIVVFGYSLIFASQIASHWGIASPFEQVLGVIAIILVLEAVRRHVGWPMLIVVLVFMTYVLWGDAFPGLLHSKNYPLTRIIGNYYLANMGIFAKPLEISSTIIIIYVLFANVMSYSKAGEFFINLAFSLVGHMRGGAAKAAVVASGFFGMISGSSVADCTATGTFTIPIMKRNGYKAEFAAAVEAAAATGAMFTPPVMGATAFLLAEIVGVPYATVAVAAVIPAALYYFCLFMQTDFEAARNNLKGVSRQEIPRIMQVMMQDNGWQFLIPLGVLILFLAILRFPPQISAFSAILALIVVRSIRPETRKEIKGYWPALEATGRRVISIVCVTAVAGLIVGSTTQTGLVFRLGAVLVDIANGHLFLLLVFAAIASFVLGMGLDVLSCYVIVATLIAPSIINAGVTPLAAHLFVLLFGAMSFITPPVCLTAYAAASLAGANPFTTGFIATRLAVVAFLVPFIFVYNPVLLLQGQFGSLELIEAIVTALLGSLALAAAMSGYLLHRMGIVARVVLAIGGILIMIPGWKTDVMGIVILAVVALLNWKLRESPQHQLEVSE